jgi:hypothetical protein
MKLAARNVMQYSLVDRDQGFGAFCCLHLQGRRIRVLFYPEIRGSRLP